MATQMTRERLKWSQQSEGGFRSGGFRSTVLPHTGTAKVYYLIFRLSRVVIGYERFRNLNLSVRRPSGSFGFVTAP